MQVILIQDVDTLGQANESVKVKNGYARNYLIPQKLAVEASPSNLKQLEEKMKVKAKKESAMLAQVKQVIAALQSGPVKIGAKTGTSGKIFGSVTALQISRAIKNQKGYEIDRKRITIVDEVKELGTYKSSIDFGSGNVAEMEFEVVGVYGDRRVSEIDEKFDPLAFGVSGEIQQGMFVECKLLKNALQPRVGCIGHRKIVMGVEPMRSG